MIVARRRLLRLGRARQPLPRRAQRAVLREHRPRPRRHRAGRRRPGQGARLLHDLVLRAPARDRARGEDRLARPRRPQPRLLHLRRRRVRRDRAQGRPPVPQAHRQPEQDEVHRARGRLPRHDARRAHRDRRHRPAPAVRAVHARAAATSRTRTSTGSRPATASRTSPRRSRTGSSSRARRPSPP